MAIFLEQTLYNGDVVRYHRVTQLRYTEGTRLVTATLSSFRSREHRELPVIPVVSREYPFVWSGNPETMVEEAYEAIMKELPTAQRV